MITTSDLILSVVSLNYSHSRLLFLSKVFSFNILLDVINLISPVLYLKSKEWFLFLKHIQKNSFFCCSWNKLVSSLEDWTSCRHAEQGERSWSNSFTSYNRKCNHDWLHESFLFLKKEASCVKVKSKRASCWTTLLESFKP